MSNHWTVILNPMAHSGRGKKHWDKIGDLLREANIPFELHESQFKRHAEELTRQAILRGERKILAVGGDGTVNEIANAILTQDEVPSTDIMIGQIPVGTGNDWGRTVGIPSDYGAAVRVIAKQNTIVQDAGLCKYTDYEGNPAERWYVNLAGMGYDAYVGETANKRKEDGKGGKMGYMLALLGCLMKYNAIPIRYRMDETKVETELFSLVVGICKYNGGGMMQAPDAVYNDGILDATVIHKLPKLHVIQQLKNLFSGAFVKHPKVFQYKGKVFHVESDERILVEVDGENIGYGPSEFSLREKCLRAVVR